MLNKYAELSGQIVTFIEVSKLSPLGKGHDNFLPFDQLVEPDPDDCPVKVSRAAVKA